MGKAKVAKNIAYVLVPIFVVLLMLATMGTAVIDEHVIITEDDYYVWKMAKGLTERIYTSYYTSINNNINYFSFNYNKRNRSK